MVYVVVAFLAHRVPDRMIAMLGGPTGVRRDGGLEVHYKPPPGVDAAALERQLARTGATIARDADTLVLEFPGIANDATPALLDMLINGGLRVHPVLVTSYARDIGASEGISLDEERFRVEDGHPYIDQFLTAPTREQLEAAIGAAQARGWRPPPDSFVQYEREDMPDGVRWRTYLLSDIVVIDGTMVADAALSYDPDTNRPATLIDLTSEGTRRFANATERMVGRKLAMVVGGRVVSAPTVNEPIRGGRLSIWGGGGAPYAMEQEANALAHVLKAGGLPSGGTIVATTWHERANVSSYEWLSRFLCGIAAAVLFGGLVFVVVRIVRPRWRTRSARPVGRFPYRRLAVTLAGPAALLVGARIPIPGMNHEQWLHADPIGITDLGISAILSAFVLVELFALIKPAWRHDPRARISLGKATAVLATVTVLIPGYFLARYIESLQLAGGDFAIADDAWFQLTTTVTLAAGTMLLAVVAGLIREHGLGNGYGVLFASAIVIDLPDYIAEPKQWIHLQPTYILESMTHAHVFALVSALTIAVITAVVLRWRVVGDTTSALRVPTPGTAPLQSVGALLGVATLVSAVAGEDVQRALQALDPFRLHLVWQLVITAAMAFGYAWLFARPALIADVAVRANTAPPRWNDWGRAALGSAGFLVVIAMVGHVGAANKPPYALVVPFAAIPVCAAVVLDIIDDARAHRATLVPVHVLHQIQRAGVVEHVLAARSIPCHIHASNLRTLLAFFGPWAPAIVLVPQDRAAEARVALGAPELGQVFG